MSRSASPAYRALVSSALRSQGVEFGDAALFLLLASFGDADGSNCFPSLQTLAGVSGRDLKAVKRAVSRLKAAGWISWCHKATPKGRVNVYTLHWAQIGPDRVQERTAIERTGGRPLFGQGGRSQKGAKTLLHVPEDTDRSDDQPLESREQR